MDRLEGLGVCGQAQCGPLLEHLAAVETEAGNFGKTCGLQGILEAGSFSFVLLIGVFSFVQKLNIENIILSLLRAPVNEILCESPFILLLNLV